MMIFIIIIMILHCHVYLFCIPQKSRDWDDWCSKVIRFHYQNVNS